MSQDILKEVLYSEHLSLPVFLLMLAMAFILGAIHALGPGHGKSLMASYLIGSTGRIRDALILALSITISHVFSVIIIGLITLWITDFFWPEKISKWIGFFSGIAVIAIGIWIFMLRYRSFIQKAGTQKTNRYTKHQKIVSNQSQNSNSTLFLPHDSSNFTHNHNNHHHHKHKHHYNPKSSVLDNIALGISSGIVPCPKAIVILLLAISLHKIALGITIIIAFSFGISVVLMLIGIVLVKASYLLKGRLEDKRLQIIPVIGALMIIALGVFLTIRTSLIL